MTGATRTVSVNNVTATKIAATIECAVVDIVEDGSVVNSPTLDYLIYMPDDGATPVQKHTGETFSIGRHGTNRAFGVGETICYIKAVGGSTTFSVTEYPR